jgi:hypothetical protein
MISIPRFVQRHRRGLRFALLASALVTSVFVLTQCRLVDRSVTGVELSPQSTSARNRCMEQCNQRYRLDRIAELIRFKAALRRCSTLPPEDRRACYDNQRNIHRTVLKKLIAERQACKNSCYNEGGGESGR